MVAERQSALVRQMFRFADGGDVDTARCRLLANGLRVRNRLRRLYQASKCWRRRPDPGRRRHGLPSIAGSEAPWSARLEAVDDTGDAALFTALRALRRQLADGRGVPAFMVFSDAVLAQLAEKRPIEPSQLLGISGIGP